MSVIVPERRARAARPPWLRVTVLALGGLAMLWLLVAAVLLWQAKHSIDAGVDRLEEARDKLSPGDLVRGEGRDALEAAQRDFERARDLVHSPVLSVFGWVPILGQQVRSVEAQTDAARDVVVIGLEAVTDAQDEFDATPRAGTARVQLLQRVAEIAGHAETRLRDVDLGPDFFLVGPVGDAHGEFAGRLSEIRGALVDARTAATGFARFLQGPRRYLLLAANNAEMRAGSGMWLSGGTLTVQGGAYDLDELLPTGDLTLPSGTVPVEGDFADRWGWLDPTHDFRNLAVSPRFEVTAPLAADMWAARTGQAVDGVLVVDPLALQGLLEGVGPIDVAGAGRLDADSVLPYVFRDQYRGLGPGDPDQQARRDQLGTVADTALAALDERPWEPPALVDGLTPAGAGRHVLAWARDPVEQDGWEAAGIAGAVGPDSLSVALMNTGGNKLDQFVPIDASLDTEAGAGAWEVTVRLRIRNEAPTGEPPYVVGPHPDSGVGEGVYLGILAVNVPGAATDVTLDGGGDLVADGADGPTTVVATTVQLARGEERELTIRFRLRARSVRIEPSARYPAIRWQFGHAAWDDTAAERVEW